MVGGPAWLNSSGYDIEAKPEDAADRKQMLLMLQTLLAERFKVSLHRETRELPVYDLKVAKGGPKLPASKEVNCMSVPSDGTPPVAPKLGSPFVAMWQDP